jgi:CheY-like chemotaxis protein
MNPILKILIIDDNQEMRRTIRQVVGRPGDEVVECDDGNDALASYRNLKPDWVLMDINMKGTNGIEATAQITAYDPSAKVIIVTDYGDTNFRAAAKKAGAASFVLKENLFDIEPIIRKKP